MSVPEYNVQTKYVIWIRNPISRFISAFNHSLALINFDISGYTKEQLFDSPATPYYRLTNKIKHKFASGCPFAEWQTGHRYEELIRYFKTPNSLAESLTSSDVNQQQLALELMTNVEVEHIARGIGWYLDSGKFIEHAKDQVLMIGVQENMQEDIGRLCEITGYNRPDTSPVRQSNTYSKQVLSPLAIENLHAHYASTDYAAIETIKKHGLIGADNYNRVVKYGVKT